MTWGGEMREMVERFRANAREHGVKAALHDVQCQTMQRLARVAILRAMVVQVGDVPDPALFEARGYEGRFATIDELARLASDPVSDLPPDFLHEALRRGDRCYALFHEGAIAAYGWYAQQATRIDERFVLHFDPAYTYMYKGYTLPHHRGKRLHAVGMCRALRAFSDEGQAGLVSYVASNNFASLNSVGRMGYRIFGSLYLANVRGRSYAYASPGCRDYDFWAEPKREDPNRPIPAPPRMPAQTAASSG